VGVSPKTEKACDIWKKGFPVSAREISPKALSFQREGERQTGRIEEESRELCTILTPSSESTMPIVGFLSYTNIAGR
jgi:hypothetical protein